MTEAYSVGMAAIRAYVNDNKGAAPMQFPNVDYTPAPGTTLWNRLTVLDTDAMQASVGVPSSNLHRQYGSILIQCFVPAGNGDGAATAEATRWKDLFLGIDSLAPNLHFEQTPSIKQVGKKGSWYQVNVSVPFYKEWFQ